MEELNLNYIIILIVVMFAAYLYLKPVQRPPPRPTPPTTTTNKQVAGKPLPSISRKKKVEETPVDAKGKLKILFGSQTGTADDFSNVLAKEAKKLQLYAQVIDLELFEPEKIKEEDLVIFCMSTHGEGEPTENAKEFYNYLVDKEKKLGPDSFSKVHYTIFGLGNKTYEHYNAVARFVDKKMEEYGAKKIYERGEGDDDCSLEEDFNRWKKKLWAPICQHLGVSVSQSVEDDKFVPRFKVIDCPTSAAGKFSTRGGSLRKSRSDGTPVHDAKNPYLAKVLVNRELFSLDAQRSCRHIELQVDESIKYQPGDHVGIYAENRIELVDQLASRLKLDLDKVISLVPVEATSLIGGDDVSTTELKKIADQAVLGPCTIRQALIDAIDITTPPRKAVLKALADFTTIQAEKARLIKLASEEGTEEYNKFIKADQRTIGEVLDAFPSVQPPLASLLELLPRLAARFYSISSSQHAHPDKIHVTAVVVNYETPTGRKHSGVCSTWLSTLSEGSQVPVFIRESHFHLPEKPTPVVMIGPGTGLAPFRGFLQELNYRRLHKGEKEWESVLYFGCRNSKHDYLYQSEIEAFKEDFTLTELHLAFSREQEQKVYVQNRLSQPESKKKIWEMINTKQGYFYVCGDARLMAKAVHQALVDIVKEEGGKTEEEANTYVDALQKSGRYLQDVWF